MEADYRHKLLKVARLIDKENFLILSVEVWSFTKAWFLFIPCLDAIWKSGSLYSNGMISRLQRKLEIYKADKMSTAVRVSTRKRNKPNSR